MSPLTLISWLLAAACVATSHSQHSLGCKVNTRLHLRDHSYQISASGLRLLEATHESFLCNSLVAGSSLCGHKQSPALFGLQRQHVPACAGPQLPDQRQRPAPAWRRRVSPCPVHATAGCELSACTCLIAHCLTPPRAGPQLPVQRAPAQGQGVTPPLLSSASSAHACQLQLLISREQPVPAQGQGMGPQLLISAAHACLLPEMQHIAFRLQAHTRRHV